MVLGCVLGVIGGAAPSTERMAGLPVNWTLALAGAAALLAAFTLRLRSGRGDGVKVEVTGSAAAVRAAIERTPGDVKALLERARGLAIGELPGAVNEIIERDVKPVLDAQASLVRAQGFARYAAHTGPWAAGERMVYRAWSAATDGHRPEAIAALTEAVPHFEEAAKAF
jgi:hypothetical protein